MSSSKNILSVLWGTTAEYFIYKRTSTERVCHLNFISTAEHQLDLRQTREWGMRRNVWEEFYCWNLSKRKKCRAALNMNVLHITWASDSQQWPCKLPSPVWLKLSETWTGQWEWRIEKQTAVKHLWTKKCGFSLLKWVVTLPVGFPDGETNSFLLTKNDLSFLLDKQLEEYSSWPPLIQPHTNKYVWTHAEIVE